MKEAVPEGFCTYPPVARSSKIARAFVVTTAVATRVSSGPIVVDSLIAGGLVIMGHHCAVELLCSSQPRPNLGRTLFMASEVVTA